MTNAILIPAQDMQLRPDFPAFCLNFAARLAGTEDKTPELATGCRPFCFYYWDGKCVDEVRLGRELGTRSGMSKAVQH